MKTKTIKVWRNWRRLSAGGDENETKSGEDLKSPAEEEQPGNADEEVAEMESEDVPNPRESVDADEVADKNSKELPNQKRLSTEEGAEAEPILEDPGNPKGASEEGEDGAEKAKSEADVRKLSSQSKSED